MVNKLLGHPKAYILFLYKIYLFYIFFIPSEFSKIYLLAGGDAKEVVDWRRGKGGSHTRCNLRGYYIILWWRLEVGST